MGNRNLYQRPPKAACCPSCGDQMVDHEMARGRGKLPTGQDYSFVVPKSKKCRGCGRLFVIKKQTYDGPGVMDDLR